MQISSTRKTYSPQTSPKTTEAPKAPSEGPQDPQDGWVGTALSVAGGVATVAGALTSQPLLTAGGALATAVGTGLTAHRIQKEGAMDTAAWVSFGVGGGLTALGALTAMQTPAPSAGPTGPLPTFLRQLGVQALPL